MQDSNESEKNARLACAAKKRQEFLENRRKREEEKEERLALVKQKRQATIEKIAERRRERGEAVEKALQMEAAHLAGDYRECWVNAHVKAFENFHTYIPQYIGSKKLNCYHMTYPEGLLRSGEDVYDLIIKAYNLRYPSFTSKYPKFSTDTNMAVVRITYSDGGISIQNGFVQRWMNGSAGHSERIALRNAVNYAINGSKAEFQDLDCISEETILDKSDIFLPYKKALSHCRRVDIFSDRGPCNYSPYQKQTCHDFFAKILPDNHRFFYATPYIREDNDSMAGELTIQLYVAGKIINDRRCELAQTRLPEEEKVLDVSFNSRILIGSVSSTSSSSSSSLASRSSHSSASSAAVLSNFSELQGVKIASDSVQKEGCFVPDTPSDTALSTEPTQTLLDLTDVKIEYKALFKAINRNNVAEVIAAVRKLGFQDTQGIKTYHNKDATLKETLARADISDTMDNAIEQAMRENGQQTQQESQTQSLPDELDWQEAENDQEDDEAWGNTTHLSPPQAPVILCAALIASRSSSSISPTAPVSSTTSTTTSTLAATLSHSASSTVVPPNTSGLSMTTVTTAFTMSQTTAPTLKSRAQGYGKDSNTGAADKAVPLGAPCIVSEKHINAA